MPRYSDLNVDGNYESVLKDLKSFIKQLENFRQKAVRDYREVKDNTEDNTDRIQLEMIRNNALKSIQEYFKLRFEAIKLHAMIADKLTPKQNKELDGKLNSGDKEDLQAALDTLRQKFKPR